MNSNAITQSSAATQSAYLEPVLLRLGKESADEYFEMKQTFNLMGWGDLPEELKLEIYEDVRFMVQEMKGAYSSCDPHVKRRRETVHFWISSYQDGICSLSAAIRGVKIKAL